MDTYTDDFISDQYPSYIQDRKLTKDKDRRSKASKRAAPSGLTFLFVVNELQLNLGRPRNLDRLGNYMPPSSLDDYYDEVPGAVFRFHNGTVTPHPNVLWRRDGLGLDGNICQWGYAEDENGNPFEELQPLEGYTTHTVFHCGPFLSIVYGVGDVIGDQSNFSGWRGLHFVHDGGVSRALATGDRRDVAGSHPRWMGRNQIIPDPHANTGSNIPNSAGLGGDTGMLIGLMGLSQERMHIDAAFQARQWHQYHWTGHKHPAAWPAADEDPRGVIVHVALDPESQCTEEHIQEFEWYHTAISG